MAMSHRRSRLWLMLRTLHFVWLMQNPYECFNKKRIRLGRNERKNSLVHSFIYSTGPPHELFCTIKHFPENVKRYQPQKGASLMHKT